MRSEPYDLQSDPQQLHNLIDEQPDVARQMRQALIGFLERCGAASRGIAAL